MNKQRRELMKRAGEFAAYTPPAMLVLMMPSIEAVASGGFKGPDTSSAGEPLDTCWGDEVTEPWTKPEYGDASDGNGNNYYDRGTNDNTKISTNDSTSASHQDGNENHGNRSGSNHPGGYVSVGDSGDSSSDSSRSSGGSDPVGDLAGSDSSLRSASNGSGSGSHNLAGHNGSSSNSRKGSSGDSNGGDTASVDASKNILIRPHQEKVVLF